MSNSVELPKLPLFAEAPIGTTEREALPFSSFPLVSVSAGARASAAAASARAGDFEAYLNRRSILRLSRYNAKAFDTAAEILRRSVYKPIKVKSDR